MASITSSTGLGTGLDISSIVSQILAAERAPVQNRLDRREAELQTKLTSYGTLKGALSGLQVSLASLKTLSTFDQRSSSSSDDTVATISASSFADIGSHSLNIIQLAKSHKLATDSALTNFTSETDTLGTGTLTFQFGTTTTGPYGFTQNADKASVDVTITDGSLKGIRDAINDANVGATASIIYDGSEYRLSIVSDDTGADNSMAITVVDSGDGNPTDTNGLSLLAYNGNAQNLSLSEAAQDAIFNIDGITGITSATNKVTDVINGLTIDLKTTGTVDLTVSRDTSNISTNINSFIAKYNALINTTNDLAKYDPDTGRAGSLNGDSVLRNVVSRIRNIISNPVEGLTSTRILAEIGISVSGADGTLVLDNSKLDSAMSSDLNGVLSLFAEIGKPTDALIDFVGSTDGTAVGDYSINITQLATQGKIVGTATVAPGFVVTAGSNDTLTLSIDGTASTITLTAGTYSTAADLVKEIEARINGSSEFSGAGVSANVTEASGILTITSNSYGSTSKINVSGGTAMTDLFGTTSVTNGVDVAGTIGGYEATGEGQYLTGTQSTAGLQIKVTGGSAGDRGTINFTSGYAKQLDGYLTELLDSAGLFTNVTDGVQGRIDSITTQREELARRLTTIEERTRSKFIALETAVAALRTTSDFLTQQLASLPKITVKGSR